MPSSASRSAHLLRADEEQIDRAAIALKSGKAFVVTLCPTDLWHPVLVRLRAKVTAFVLPDPVEIGDAWQMLDALVEQVGRRDRVLSFTLGQDVMSVLDGLNLHREKVLRGGPVILWVPDADALMQVRTRAPDAFSFRSTMVVVRGDGGPLPRPSGEEPEEVTRARGRLRRAKLPLDRAAAQGTLAEHLRVRKRYEEAESLARAALDDLAMADTEESSEERAHLCHTLGLIAVANGRTAERFHWSARALVETANVSPAIGAGIEAMTGSTFPGPSAGLDRASVRRALDLTRSHGLGPKARSQALRSAARVAVWLGDLRAARAHLREWPSIDRYVVATDEASALMDVADVESVAGDLTSAETRCREAAAAVVAKGGSPDPVLLGKCFLWRGEVDAARGVATGLASEEGAPAHTREYAFNADVEMERGDVAAALAALREAARQAEAQRADGYLVQALVNLVGVLERGSEADRVSPAEVAAARAELTRGEAVVLAFTAPDTPPWYPITFLTLRARVLAITPDTLPQALDLARQALALAPSAYPDLLPETGRTLADLLLRADQPDEALIVVADTEPEAASRGFLKERALLLASRVLALVQRGAAPSAIEPHLAALREALAATDAPRITAETLRDLAKRLPLTATTPDPHALAEEALGLFVAMPMPAQESRCFEIKGDVLVVRGNPDEAGGCYLIARKRLESYGLGLRLSLLDRKIDALA